MLRILFTYVIPLVLPAAAYLGYRIWDDWRRRKTGAETRSPWEAWPWYWIAGSGFACLAASLVWLVIDRAPADANYTPARVIDGKVVPGEIVPRDGGR